MYPNAEVIGTDLSPIQPSWVPPNCFFEIEDATQAWTFKENDFDLVHMRYLVGSIPDWTELFKQAYRVLKPGGWLESFESDAPITSKDGTVKDESALHQWGIMFGEAGKRTGRSFLVIDEDLQRKAMEEAGFVNIMQFDFDVSGSLFSWLHHLRRNADALSSALSRAGRPTKGSRRLASSAGRPWSGISRVCSITFLSLVISITDIINIQVSCCTCSDRSWAGRGPRSKSTSPICAASFATRTCTPHSRFAACPGRSLKMHLLLRSGWHRDRLNLGCQRGGGRGRNGRGQFFGRPGTW